MSANKQTAYHDTVEIAKAALGGTDKAVWYNDQTMGNFCQFLQTVYDKLSSLAEDEAH